MGMPLKINPVANITMPSPGRPRDSRVTQAERSALHILDTKNSYPRTIPLTPKAVEVIKNLPQTYIPQTCTSVIAITCNAIRSAWERLKKKAGVNDMRFHDLRHEAISSFFEMGLSVPEVALISGYRDPRMLFRYTHLKAEEVGKKFKHMA